MMYKTQDDAKRCHVSFLSCKNILERSDSTMKKKCVECRDVLTGNGSGLLCEKCFEKMLKEKIATS